LRHLFKEALRGFLPAEILIKKKQGFGLPFGLWLVEHRGLRELTGDSLESLKGRGIVRREFIDELLGRHQAEHAAYYGTMVWTLLMLEQWLAARENP
jgi:asparagine synthase (glutamine-hydrolysing)